MTTTRRKQARRRPAQHARAARKPRPAVPEDELPPVRKLVAFDARSWQTIDLLARDSMRSFQELADEAFRDLLRKHGRADTLRGALEKSAAAVSAKPPARKARAARR